MRKFIETELRKYTKSLGKIAFLLGATYEQACSQINKDLQPELQTRLVPEIIQYKTGKLQIIWNVKKRYENTGAVYYRREWPHYQARYPSWQLDSIAQPSELGLALKIEKCFAWIREASATITALNNSAKRLDEIARMLSPRVKNFNNKYQGHRYGGNIERILEGLYEDQDIWEDLSERTIRDETDA